MDACGWNGGTHQDRIRRSLNRMQELISRLTSSCYALWKGSLESPTSSTSQKSVCVSRPVVPAPFLSFCSCCEPSFSEKSCPFRPRFRPAASRFQPPVSAKGVDSPNFPSLRAAKSGRRDLKIKKRGFSMRGNRRWPCSGGTPCTLLSRFSSRFFALWIFALSRGNFELEKGREEEKERRILWKFDRSKKSFEERGESVGWVFVEIWDRRGRRILNFDNFVKIWSRKREEIERDFEERMREGFWNLTIWWKFDDEEVRRGFWILIILWKFARSKRILRRRKNFEFWQSCDIFVDSKKF